MLTVERNLTIDRPIHDVFEYLSDFTHTEQWDPGTVSTTRTDDGPLGVGATFHNISMFRGKKTELDYEISRYDAGSLLEFTGNNKTATARDHLEFSGDAASTTVRYRATFEFHGVARLAAPFLRRGLDNLADETVAKMKDALERIL
jgi:uncharacterized protein YndB with AHSA1/START domain